MSYRKKTGKFYRPFFPFCDAAWGLDISKLTSYSCSLGKVVPGNRFLGHWGCAGLRKTWLMSKIGFVKFRVCFLFSRFPPQSTTFAFHECFSQE